MCDIPKLRQHSRKGFPAYGKCDNGFKSLMVYPPPTQEGGEGGRGGEERGGEGRKGGEGRREGREGGTGPSNKIQSIIINTIMQHSTKWFQNQCMQGL